MSASHPNQQARPKPSSSQDASRPRFPSLLSILSKNRRRFAVPAGRWSLTAARGSPAEPDLSLDFEGHPAGRASSPPPEGMYIVRPLWPVNIPKLIFFAGSAGPEDPAGLGVYGQATRACQRPGSLLPAAAKHRFTAGERRIYGRPTPASTHLRTLSREHFAMRQRLVRPTGRGPAVTKPSHSPALSGRQGRASAPRRFASIP